MGQGNDMAGAYAKSWLRFASSGHLKASQRSNGVNSGGKIFDSD
jgi:hypothetical protein